MPRRAGSPRGAPSWSPITRAVGPTIEIAATTGPPGADFDRHRQRRQTELGLVDAAGVAPLADTGQLGQEHLRHDDRVAGARRQPGAQPGLDHRRVERGEDLAGTGAVDRRAAGVRRVAQRVHALDAFDVHDVGARRHAELDGLAEGVAQLDQQRQALGAHGRARRRQIAVLDEAQPEPVAPVRRPVEQPPADEHRAGAVGRALGDADAPSQFTDPQLWGLGERIEDVESDRDGLQRRATGDGRSYGSSGVAEPTSGRIVLGADPAQ